MPIGEDVWEFIESIGLGHSVFVMEVLALRLGSPKELARKIWHLDKFEEEYFRLKKEIEVVNQLIEKLNDRYNKREAKSPLGTKISDHSYRPKNKQKSFGERNPYFFRNFSSLRF